jgi:hypothetical protein
MKAELLRRSADQFVVLILDNEVTVGEFVANPPLCWTRLVVRHGIFEIPEGYPTVLTAAQARFEMKNWDQVSLPAISRALAERGATFDYFLFGNNAGQGLPLAQSLAPDAIANRAAIIYANSLPEKEAYQKLGYRTFFRRSEAVSHILTMAKNASRSPALCFINTIQHNEFNYHDP